MDGLFSELEALFLKSKNNSRRNEKTNKKEKSLYKTLKVQNVL